MPKSVNKAAPGVSRFVAACLLYAVAIAGGRGAEAATALQPPTLPPVEIVVDREAGDLVFYVDDYASNQPMEGLQLDVTVGNRRLRARTTTEGRYRLPADLLGTPCPATIPVTVRGPGLDASLSVAVPAPAEPAAIARERGNFRWVAVAILPGVVVVMALALRGRRDLRVDPARLS